MLSSPEMRAVVSSCFFSTFRGVLSDASCLRQTRSAPVVDIGRACVRNQNDLYNCVSGDESLDAITIEDFEAVFLSNQTTTNPWVGVW